MAQPQRLVDYIPDPSAIPSLSTDELGRYILTCMNSWGPSHLIHPVAFFQMSGYPNSALTQDATNHIHAAWWVLIARGYLIPKLDMGGTIHSFVISPDGIAATQNWGKARRYGALPIWLHPRVVDSSRASFVEGKPAQSVALAFRDLEIRVREETNGGPREGLLAWAFNAQKGQLRDETMTDRSQLEGHMHLAAGAALAFRNPNTHGNEIEEELEAVEALALASYLHRHIDRVIAARIPPETPP